MIKPSRTVARGDEIEKPGLARGKLYRKVGPREAGCD
jgi:hypothetical protein